LDRAAASAALLRLIASARLLSYAAHLWCEGGLWRLQMLLAAMLRVIVCLSVVVPLLALTL
jgi:hypothetical protein